MNIAKSIALISLSSAVLLAAPLDTQDKKIKRAIELGNTSSKILLKTLKTKMKKHMADGGAMEAFSFCSDEAYSLTDSVNKTLPSGITTKRISLKYRNPANAPKEDEANVLNSIETLKKSNVVLPEYFIEKVDENRFKYYKPIVINDKACLKCHGEPSKDVELRRAINERYPIDKAKNYEMGDVRGAVVVTIQY